MECKDCLFLKGSIQCAGCMNSEGSDEEIHHPDHYTFRGGIEPKEFINSNNFTHAEGNIIKYVYRWPKKQRIKSLYKALENLMEIIKTEELKLNGRIK